MSKEKNVREQNDSRKRTTGRLMKAILVVLLLAIGFAAVALLPGEQKTPAPAVPTTTAEVTTQPTEVQETMEIDPNSVNLGYGIYVTDIGAYTGIYMEDGSDEVVSGVLMMIVENKSEEDIQYARIAMDFGEETAQFQLTTLAGGDRMVLLEQNRMAHDREFDYSSVLPMASDVAYFQNPISTEEDRVEVTLMDGMVNVKNISGKDIPGKITIYYKNAADDLYYGGITYRVSVENLKAGELRQTTTKHASESGSRVVFVTIEE